MAGNGPGGSFDLPDAVLAVLPSDPFEQLDVARKITSIALASRVSRLESEAARLRQALAERDDLVAELRARVEASDAALADLSQKVSRADQEKEKLMNENALLSNTVKKLNRDVSKLEVFKKTLMQSLSEEEEGTQGGGPQVLPKQISGVAGFSSGLPLGEEDAAPPPLKKSSSQTQISETGSSVSEDVSYGDSDAPKQGIEHGLRLPSYNTTPRLTPPGSPPRLSAAVSSTKLSRPLSPPRRHSIAFSTTRNMFDEKSSVYSSMPSSNRNTMTSPFDTGTQAGRARVDGKEFFRQVRSRLSYEQFSAFLANVKELNSHKQTREETLQKAEEIFGADNKDLYAIFEGLISRNLH